MMTWEEAEDWCLKEHGVHLVTIHDHAENTMAQNACSWTKGCWIGARRGGDDIHSGFVWSDGIALDYSAWNESENHGPWNLDFECVHLDGNGSWIVSSCDAVFSPLCGAPGSVRRSAMYL